MTNPKVWVGKGLSAVWQSTLANVRSSAMLPAFKSALTNSSNDQEVEVLLTTVAEKTGQAYLALCVLAADHYREFGATIEYNDMQSQNETVPDIESAGEFRSHIETFVIEYGEIYDWASEHWTLLEERIDRNLHLDLPMDYYFAKIQTYIFGGYAVKGLGSLTSPYGARFHVSIDITAPNDLGHPWSKLSHPLFWVLQGLISYAIMNRHNLINYNDVPANYNEEYSITDPREVTKPDTLKPEGMSIGNFFGCLGQIIGAIFAILIFIGIFAM